MIHTLQVTSEKFAYDVVTGRGGWRALRRFPLVTYSSVFVLSEKPLWKRWGSTFLRESGFEPARPPTRTQTRTVLVPSGEGSKAMGMVEVVATQLLKGGADRRSLLIVFGGGVVGDLGGFVASTYMRGIDYVQVPTTVVGQVDSAVGGKTAVNVGAMKNLVGTFYPPRLVVAEPLVLSSLSGRAFRSGLYEVVKHAILAGDPFFGQLEKSLDSLHPQNTSLLEPMLASAVAVKVGVVNRDEREAGLRLVLNLGHTFGHAFEEVTGYSRFLHGEAVGWGLLTATRLAERLRLLAPDEGERIARLVRRVGPLPPIRDLPPAKVLKLLPQDKKAIGGKIRWVLPERVGKVKVVADVPVKEVAAALKTVSHK
ncbi:MAG: 3-dehydroquinate synthase [Terriglobia bacterium]